MLKFSVLTLILAVAVVCGSPLGPEAQSSTTLAPLLSPPSTEATPKNLCGANSQSMESHFNLMCYDNCQNKDQRGRPCPYDLFYGSFCKCNEGFIYRTGTSGDCVLPSQCP